MTDPAPPLFTSTTTHAVVQCVACPHSVTLRPEDVPQGITAHSFERKAKCSKMRGRVAASYNIPKDKKPMGHRSELGRFPCAIRGG